MNEAAHARRGYRPALDGIRAVAVVAVIAFHATSALPGGYLGVDVFFVLSGYLITGLLLHEWTTTGRIRFPGFWARRARRLLPAVLLLLAVVAIVAARTVSVLNFPARRADLLSTLFYYANWHFIASGQSYFATYTGLSPLRHTWSLAIEEQFYLVWPVLLLGVIALMSRFTRRSTRDSARRSPQDSLWLACLMIGGAIASAVTMAALFNPLDPARAYYGTDTRSHELLIGAALAALVHARPRMLTDQRARRAAVWVAPLAVAGVAAAFVGLGDQDAFYYRGGSLAFAVVVAAGIWAVEARPRFVLGALLSIPVMRWIGSVSYGLYLWHWPLIVWIGESDRFATWNTTEKVALEIALTFVIAAASFYLLERPIRFGKVPWLRTSGPRLALLASIAMLLVAELAVQSTAISSPKIATQVNDRSDSDCPAGSPSVGRFSWCSRTKPATRDSAVVAVIGDSTSRALDPGMRQIATNRGWQYIQAGQNGCSFSGLFLPTKTPYPEALAAQRACRYEIPTLITRVESTTTPDVWIISDILPARNNLVLSNGTALAPGDAGRDQILIGVFRRTLRRLTAHGASVVFLEPAPRAAPVDCAVTAGGDSCSDPIYSRADALTIAFNRIVRRSVAGLPRVSAVSVVDILCPKHGRCPPLIHGVLARYDGVHYTGTFSTTIVRVIIARAERAGVVFRHTK